MDGLKTACLYAFGCPELKMPNAEAIIKVFIRDLFNQSKRISSNFNTRIMESCQLIERTEPYLFYQLIAMANGVESPFDEDVVRSYWLGGKFLTPFTSQNLRILVKNGRIPEDFPKLAGILIKLQGLIGAKPHHNFSVFQTLSGLRNSAELPEEVAAKILDDVNKCLVKHGKIIRSDEFGFEVETIRIAKNEGGIVLIRLTERIEKGFVRRAEQGRWVSIHFGSAREKISLDQARELAIVTEEAFSFALKGRS